MAFVVRSGMRLMPLLALRQSFTKNQLEPFSHWQLENRAKHLLAMFFAEQFSFSFVFGYSSYAAYDSVSNSCKDAYDDVYVSINDAVHSTNSNAYLTTQASNLLIVGTIYNAIHIAQDRYPAYIAEFGLLSQIDYVIDNKTADPDKYFGEIEKEIRLLAIISAQELLEQPLWSTTPPESWQKLLAYFRADTLSLNAGFEVWLDWYDDRLAGRHVDTNLLRYWNNIPEEVQSQGVAKINAYLKNFVLHATHRPLNRVRAIFIGYGEAGKTSLIRALGSG